MLGIFLKGNLIVKQKRIRALRPTLQIHEIFLYHLNIKQLILPRALNLSEKKLRFVLYTLINSYALNKSHNSFKSATK